MTVIATRLGDRVKRFAIFNEDRGRLREYLEPIPVWLILDEDAAFFGPHARAEVEGIG